jgi:hypothetical protein
MAVECPAAGRPPAVHGMLLAQAVSDVGTLPERDWEVSAGAQYRLLATVAVQLQYSGHNRPRGVPHSECEMQRAATDIVQR